MSPTPRPKAYLRHKQTVPSLGLLNPKALLWFNTLRQSNSCCPLVKNQTTSLDHVLHSTRALMVHHKRDLDRGNKPRPQTPQPLRSALLIEDAYSVSLTTSAAPLNQPSALFCLTRNFSIDLAAFWLRFLSCSSADLVYPDPTIGP